MITTITVQQNDVDEFTIEKISNCENSGIEDTKGDWMQIIIKIHKHLIDNDYEMKEVFEANGKLIFIGEC